MEYLIRRAEAGDAAGIRDVAANVRFQPGVADGAEGYLVGMFEVAEYEERLGRSAGSMVAVDAEGRVVAFLLTDEAYRLTVAGASSEVVLIDQIGVRREAAGAGLGQRMMDAMTRVVRPERMAASIMHRPVRNAKSMRFFAEKNGFRYVGSEWDGEFEWGIYIWEANAE